MTGSLFRKYVVYFIALVCALLVVNALVSMYFTYQQSKSALLKVQHEKAVAAAARVETFMQEIERSLGWMRWSQVGSSGYEQRRIEYLKLLSQVPAITDVSLLDENGRERLRVSRLDLDRLDSGADLSALPAFQTASAGKTYFGPVNFRKETEPYMTIAAGGQSPQAGISVADVNLKFIWDLISRIRFGEKGIAYVVDARGQLVAHPDIGLVLSKSDLSSLSQVNNALAARLNDDQGPVAVGKNLAGEEVLTSYASIAPLGWYVFAEQPVGEAFAPIYSLLQRTLLLLLVGLALAVLASLYVARRMVKPIESIRAGAAQIAHGNLGERIEVKTGDELELLADEFNNMAHQLEESYSSLERTVEARTSELAELNRTLETRVVDGVAQIERLGRLKRFFSPQLADLIVSGETEDPLKSHRREVTVVFLDLRGFTSFTETADPEEVMSVLREYHKAMGELIMKHGGTLERFTGDGIMIFFNDPLELPNPSRSAAIMAFEMQRCFRQLCQAWRKRGYELDMGIGIAQGYATIGAIGFEGRSDYGAIGVVTNLAARLCGEAKGGQILVAQRVLAAIEELVQAEPVGDLSLKGFHRSFPVFNVTALNPVN